MWGWILFKLLFNNDSFRRRVEEDGVCKSYFSDVKKVILKNINKKFGCDMVFTNIITALFACY